MSDDDSIYIGTSNVDTQAQKESLLLKLANRHGLITGATGTGKTVSLQILAEGFSDAGRAGFLRRCEGRSVRNWRDGCRRRIFWRKRAKKIGFEGYGYHGAYPTVFWDLFGKKGHPIRTTVQEMGPLLLSRMLDINDTQEGVMNIAFRLAQEEELPLLDLKDLRKLMIEVSNRAKELSSEYGNVSKSSVGAIQRRLLVLEEQGAEEFFGEPALKISEFMRTTYDGKALSMFWPPTS